jgi:hypothetical protein
MNDVWAEDIIANCSTSAVERFDVDISGNLNPQEYARFLADFLPDCYNATSNLTVTQNTTFEEFACECPFYKPWCSCDENPTIDPEDYENVCRRAVEVSAADGCTSEVNDMSMIEECAQALVEADVDQNNQLTYQEFENALKDIHAECYNESMPSVIWPIVARAVCAVVNGPYDLSCYNKDLQNATFKFLDITGAVNNTNEPTTFIVAVCLAMDPIARWDCNIPNRGPDNNTETLPPTPPITSTLPPSITTYPITPVVSSIYPTTAPPTAPESTPNPATPQPTTTNSTTSQESPNTAAIAAGSAVGGLLAVILLLVLGYWLWHRDDQKNQDQKVSDDAGEERPHSHHASSQASHRDLSMNIHDREIHETNELLNPKPPKSFREPPPDEERSTSVYTSTTSSGDAMAAYSTSREVTERVVDTTLPEDTETNPNSQEFLSNLPTEENPPPAHAPLIDGETCSTLIPDYKEMIGCYPTQVVSVEGETISTAGGEEQGEGHDEDSLLRQEYLSSEYAASTPSSVVESAHVASSNSSNVQLPDYKDQVTDHQPTASNLPTPLAGTPSDITFSQFSPTATNTMDSVVVSVLSDSVGHEQVPLATAHPLDNAVESVSSSRSRRIPTDPEGSRFPSNRNRRQRQELIEEEEEEVDSPSTVQNTSVELEQLQQRIRDLEDHVRRKSP